MSDEQNVDAGSETSGETAAVDTTATEQSDTAATTDTTDTAATDTAQADAGASADAGGAADETKTDVAVDASRTGFVANGQPGGECTCPDGRKGTIHRFDAGLVCIPNHDQG